MVEQKVIHLNQDTGSLPQEDHILVITDYKYEYWEGSGEAVTFDGEYVYIWNLGHCSCYGPFEESWQGGNGISQQLTLEEYKTTAMVALSDKVYQESLKYLP